MECGREYIVEIMIEFVRAAIFEREPNVIQNEVIDWDELMDISVEQGVLAWVWDGICKLPKEQQPPRIQRINFGMSAQEIWDCYERQKQVLSTIISTCNQYSIRVLLLKGLSLSQLYPKPQSRSCGDIDIYTFDDYEKFNKIFDNQFKYVEGKHAVFYFGDIMVENHHEFLNPDTRCKIEIGNYFKSHLNEIRITDSGYLLMDPMTNMIFLTMHTIKHLNADAFVPVRSITDFAIFLDSHRKELPPSRCHEELKKIKMEQGFEVLLYMSEFFLGFQFNEYNTHLIPPRHINYLRCWMATDYHKLNEAQAIERGFFSYVKVMREKYYRRHYTFRSKKISKEFRGVLINLIRACLKTPSSIS